MVKCYLGLGTEFHCWGTCNFTFFHSKATFSLKLFPKISIRCHCFQEIYWFTIPCGNPNLSDRDLKFSPLRITLTRSIQTTACLNKFKDIYAIFGVKKIKTLKDSLSDKNTCLIQFKGHLIFLHLPLYRQLCEKKTDVLKLKWTNHSPTLSNWLENEEHSNSKGFWEFNSKQSATNSTICQPNNFVHIKQNCLMKSF